MHGDGMYDACGPYEGDVKDTTEYVVEAIFFDGPFNCSEIEGSFDVFGVRPEVEEDTHRMTAAGVALEGVVVALAAARAAHGSFPNPGAPLESLPGKATRRGDAFPRNW